MTFEASASLVFKRDSIFATVFSVEASSVLSSSGTEGSETEVETLPTSTPVFCCMASSAFCSSEILLFCSAMRLCSGDTKLVVTFFLMVLHFSANRRVERLISND